MSTERPPLPRLLLAGASATFGIYALYYLTDIIKPLWSTLAEKGGAASDFVGIDLPFVDDFLRLETSLFSIALSTWTGQTLSLPLFLIALPVLAIFAIESARSSARWFVSWFAPHALLFQIFGIGVTTPLLWLPSWILTYTGSRPFAPVPVPVVKAISAALLTVSVIILGLFLTANGVVLPTPLTFNHLVTAFQSAPILIPLILIATKYLTPTAPPTKTSIHASSSAIQSLYTTLGISLIPFHIYSLYSIFGIVYGAGPKYPAQGWDDIKATILDPQTPSQVSAHVFFSGFVALLGSVVVWVWSEEGWEHALGLLQLTIKTGPGAAVSFIARTREERILGGVVRGVEGVKEKKDE
ncbi:hypothetical protein HDV00_010628 [Rhizophlyctis rosea]|nr:hypothetical protein HDV00_010628 [Rhizophlyctis rosea]